MELQAVVWHLQMVVLVIVLEVTWQPLAVEQVMAGRTILRPRRSWSSSPEPPVETDIKPAGVETSG